MNKKGFTLVELIATLVVLGIVASITVVSISSIFSSTKEKTEDVFVETIKDALDIYLASDAKEISDWTSCGYTIDKSYKTGVKVYWTSVSMRDVIENGSLTDKDFVNPASDLDCANPDDVKLFIYKDEDHVYYYSVNKVDFGCLNDEVGVISNLPKVLDGSGNGVYFTCP